MAVEGTENQPCMIEKQQVSSSLENDESRQILTVKQFLEFKQEAVQQDQREQVLNPSVSSALNFEVEKGESDRLAGFARVKR